ncbi:hypothetical protein JRO89_XS03G0057500 [Xanthoceras sorbifolium]|uniref:Protein arginine methyltransferase NDUFAF7 n=1 Tax=Xanthoceras sorbifolium TaxID=99658 RepID=A0ABQ8I8T1_9ROSI|nr:hypothetical protein JRO89_XS03G0057500 [Xanthoceras sorbifolium]
MQFFVLNLFVILVNALGQVRDFVRSALYDPEHGYFSQRSGSVGVLDSSIKFNQLEGRKAYMKHLDKIYKQSDISWFTPVELFKPWYAHGIAEAIMRTANLSVPLKIYEIGGGSGTCAKGIMDYIMLNAPERIYNNMTYVSVEISPSLAQIQKETVGQVRSHSSKFRVECRDAAEKGGWGHGEQQPCWVIMLEVLDNLPHDLIYSENQDSPWMEVWVEKQQDRLESYADCTAEMCCSSLCGLFSKSMIAPVSDLWHVRGGTPFFKKETLSELYKPLEDNLITRCIEVVEWGKDHTQGSGMLRSIWSKVFPRPRRCWLPTGCLKLLEVLHEKLPKMSLIASDFSFLPDVKIPGERAPLVSTKKDGQSQDYTSYLDAKGDADIFFPTDFQLLERIDHYCSGWLKMQKDKSSKQGKKRRTITLDSSSFMEEFGLPTKTRTKDGYNPLLDDFKNTKFYLSVPTHNTK